MSDTLIESLNRRISELTSQVAGLQSEAKERRLAGKKYKGEAEDLRQALLDLEADRDEWQRRAEAAPSDLQAKVDELQAQVRARDHRDAWKAALPDLHAKADVEDLWRKVGYRPESDTPDPNQIRELVGKAREAAPYLFQAADATSAGAPRGAEQPQRPAFQAGPGGGRGAPDTTPGRFVVRSSDLTNGQWVSDNWSRMQAAQKEGNLQVIE